MLGYHSNATNRIAGWVDLGSVLLTQPPPLPLHRFCPSPWEASGTVGDVKVGEAVLHKIKAIPREHRPGEHSPA